MFHWIRKTKLADRASRRHGGHAKTPRLTLETLESRDLLTAALVAGDTWIEREQVVAVPQVELRATEAHVAVPFSALFGPAVGSEQMGAIQDVDPGIEDPGASFATIRVSGVSVTRFNSLTAPVHFVVAKDRYSSLPGDVEVRRNGILLPAESQSVTAAKISLKNALVEGRNDFQLKAYDQRGLPLYFQATVWAGSRDLTVNLVDETGKPIKTRASVKALLGDDQSVFAAKSAAKGKITFHNVPDRTIFLEGKAGSRIGFIGVTGSAGEVQLVLRKFEAITNSADGDGQASGVGPLEADAATTLDAAAQPVFGTTLSTSGEGEVRTARSFQTHLGTSAVRVRYRFITSEVPGGWFGSKYNDYFRVALRTSQGGMVSDANSMNGLGLAAFDAQGATQWMEKTLKVNPKGSAVEFQGAVANVGDGLFDSTLEVSVEEVRAELTYQLSWDNVHGGLKVTWTAKSDIAEATQVGVYFANGAAYANRLGSELFTFSVPAGTKAGASKVVQVPGNVLVDAPGGTTHLLVASNDADAQAIADVRVGFGAAAEAGVVSQHTIDVVKNALRAAGQPSATITSTLRRPEDQARAMFNNLVNPAHTLQQNIQAQLALYGPAGDQVVNVFAQMAQGLTLAQVMANQAAIRQAMTDRIVELAQQGQRVSRHCVTPEQYALLNVIDVGRGVFTAASRARFIASASSQAATLIDEPQNNCIHIEVAQ